MSRDEGTTPLIGRAGEMRGLFELIGIDDPGGSGSVLLSGDAGVGKARLLQTCASEPPRPAGCASSALRRLSATVRCPISRSPRSSAGS